MSPTLDEAAAELYAVEPGRFTAERTRLGGEARAAGETDTAKAIGELRRPTTSAWLINQLVRGEQGAADEVERLEELGRDLRGAQAALDAPRMRELTKERHQLVGALVRRADDVASDAGQKVSPAVRRELEDTLGAAVADDQASLAVMSGRLTRALTYAGFGEVDITEATATPLSAVHPYRARRGDGERGSGAEASTHKDSAGGDLAEKESPGKGTGPSPDHRTMKRSDSKLAAKATADPGSDPGTRTKTTHEPDAAAKQAAEQTRAEELAERRAQAEELLQQARAEVEAAEEALQQKERELDQATSEQAELQNRLSELQAEVVAVRRKLDAGDRQVSHAERDRQRQERQLKDVTKALDRAEAARDRLDPA